MMSLANYTPLNAQCDGLPKLPIGSIEGTCLGLVASDFNGVKFIKPRKAIELAQSHQLLITDMGGWTSGKGACDAS